jgi:hypothetical protein
VSTRLTNGFVHICARNREPYVQIRLILRRRSTLAKTVTEKQHIENQRQKTLHKETVPLPRQQVVGDDDDDERRKLLIYNIASEIRRLKSTHTYQ